MRVLYVIGSLRTGGAEKQAMVSAEALARRGHDVQIATMYPGGQFWDQAVNGGLVRVRSLFGSHPGAKWHVARQLATAPSRLRQAIQEIEPDIVYSILHPANFIARLAAAGTYRRRLVWGIRSSGRTGSVVDTFAFYASALLSSSVRLTISNSRAGREYHARRGFRPQRWALIPNGIDTSVFRPDKRVGAALRAAWRVAEDERLVGSIGRLNPLKDHLNFFRAARQIRAADRRVRFVVVGSGTRTFAQQLRTRVHEAGLERYVIWAGERDDMPAVYNAIDVLCSSSRVEGFSNVIGEAMASGVPCVVTDTGDSAYLVGQTGRVVPVGDSHELAAAVLSLLRDGPADPRTRIQQNFSVDVLADSLEREFVALSLP